MSKNFQPLSSGEVLSVGNESQIVIGHSTFRVSEFTAALKQLMLENGVGGVTPETIDWLTAEGIDCDVLRFGSDGWVKGKVRLHLEFSEDSDAEVSPDPKTEAAIESFAPVAAATSVIAESAASEIDDLDLDFADDEFDFPEDSATPISSAETTVDAKDTFVQEDDESFDDLFAADELEETSEESGDTGLDDLFAEDALEETGATELGADDSIISSDEGDFDAAVGEFADLLGDADSESDSEAIAETEDHTALDAAVAPQADEDELNDLFGDDSLFDEDSSTETTIEDQEGVLAGLDTELESIGEDTADDSLDFDFGDGDLEADSSAELESVTDDSDDDLFGDAEDDLFADAEDSSPAETDTAAETLAAETLDELGLDADEDSDDLFADAEDLFGEDESSESANDADASLEELSFDDDDSDSILPEDDSSDDGAFADFGEFLTEESSEPDTDDGAELGLDNLFDEDDSDAEESLFDDPFEEAIAPEDTAAASDDDFLTDFEAAGDTEISQGDSANPENALESTFNSTFNEEENDFSFEQSDLDFDGSMDDEVANLLLDNEDEISDEDDLTAEELPPEIDFGSTEDLGEFIDVSIMKKKMASPASAIETESPADTAPQMESPFDLGDNSGVMDSGEEDISLGELFESNDDEDFDFDALDDGDDPLDAVTGDEEEVSADIWELE
ncbi:KGK domain-containing protein [[Limnothrix rosea] IAM M-220]|uniref:KGK domain-containing protein n=1 Tax=[Limnothrix rosea] IAM M-220 TaxID=454133 RepID=UPI000961DC80|nr:KGK domain-containing protein [[Limnothrix rosea] IAM M-220]OKH16084.1 hypothetical protein NIES208_12020 [[Limnothrix rosea] IAM M-220]